MRSSNCIYKENWTEFTFQGFISEFKFPLTLGYLNPALDNQGFSTRAGGEGKNSRRRRDLQALKVRMSFWKKFLNLRLLERIFSSLEQKLRVFKQITDIITFWLFFSVRTWILSLNWGYFQRKVGGEFTWNGRRISPATGSYELKQLRRRPQRRLQQNNRVKWCYTERFATTIFSARQPCNIGTMLQPFETMSQQWCNAVLY